MTWQASPWQSSLQAAFTTIWGSGVSPIPSLDLNFTLGSLDPRITYTGASLATLTDSTGKVAYKPHNLFVWSSDFSNAEWQKSGGGTGTTTVTTPNYGTAPDGTLTASRFVADKGVGTTEGDYSMMLQTIPSTIGPYTGAIYAKSNTGLSQDVLVYVAAGGQYNKQVVSVGNTWVRLSPATTTSAGGTGGLVIGCRGGSAPGYSGGQQSLDLLVWGAQLNVGPLQTYYPTTSAAYYGPRFTYDPVTHAALGLLIEEQRTNLATYSQDLSNAVWAKSGSSVSLVAASAPDGGGAYKLVENSATSDHRVSTVATVSIGQAYSTAIYAKQAGRTAIKFYANMQGGTKSFVVDLVTGAVSGSSMPSAPVVSNAGGGYWRIAYTETADITSIIGIYVVLLNGGVESYLGDGASGVYIWGAQLEAGAFATSYIPTTSASVTRAADSATMTGSNFSSWFNATQGTFVVNGITPPAPPSVAVFVQVDSGAETEKMTARYYAAGNWFFDVYSGGGATQASLDTGSATANAPFKIAGSYALNAFAACRNGGAVISDSSGTPPTVNRLVIGCDGVQRAANAPISRLRYYPVALTNAQLQALTT